MHNDRQILLKKKTTQEVSDETVALLVVLFNSLIDKLIHLWYILYKQNFSRDTYFRYIRDWNQNAKNRSRKRKVFHKMHYKLYIYTWPYPISKTMGVRGSNKIPGTQIEDKLRNMKNSTNYTFWELAFTRLHRVV